MPNLNTLLSEVKEAETLHLLSKRTKRNFTLNKALSTLSLLASIGMLINMDYQQKNDIIELQTNHIINYKNPSRYIERTKGDLRVSSNKNNKEIGMIMKNLNSNPFYEKSNMDLLKNVKIKGHLSSETPYIPIGDLKLKDGHLLKGNNRT
jgi:hypothetical protein